MVFLRKYLSLGLCSFFLMSTANAQDMHDPALTEGDSQIIMIITTDAENEALADRLTASHARYTRENDPREGENALILYTLQKGPDYQYSEDYAAEDLRSDQIVYMITQTYKSRAGLVDNLIRVHSEWEDFGEFARWGSGMSTTIRRDTTVIEAF